MTVRIVALTAYITTRLVLALREQARRLARGLTTAALQLVIA